MTITEQIHLFNHLTPYEFVEFSLEMKNRNIDLAIVWYAKIYLKERNSQLLTAKEKAFKEKWHPSFSSIDFSDYVALMRFPEMTHENGNEFLKDIFRSLRKDIKENENSIKNDRGALLKLLEEIYKNIDFSSTDRKTKGLGYTLLKFLELLDFAQAFKGYEFKLQNINIKLTPKQFMHILVGHVKDYLVPRKGMLVPFAHISQWHEVFLLINSVILFIQKDLETHFKISKQEYNNTMVVLGDNKYGIHISKKGVIKTFYPLPY